MIFNKQRLKDFFSSVYHREMTSDKTIDVFLEVLAQLSDQEMSVVIERYGLSDNEPKSLSKIAECFGTDAETIKEVEMSALEKLRQLTNNERVNEDSGEAFIIENNDYLPDGITFADINEKLDRRK